MAPDEDAVRKHTQQGGFPANRTSRIRCDRSAMRPQGTGRLKIMAKRLAQVLGRRKRSHQGGQAEKIIPINHETAEVIAQQKELFREQFDREPGPDEPLFFEPSVADRNFLAMSLPMKYGRAYCRLLAILQ
jgi:hypothetical protein